MLKFELIRKEYPVLDKYVYLDTATHGLFSRSSYEAIQKHLTLSYETALDIPGYIACWEFADELRKDLAQVINAEKNEIFYGTSSSDLLAVFTSGLTLPAGSEVLITDQSFPSTARSWKNREAEGIRVKILTSENGCVSYERLEKSISKDTRVISLSMVEQNTGYRHDLYRIGKLCKEKGIVLVIDATQTVGALEIDVKKMNIDFLCTSAYKYLNGLLGIGFGYIKKDFIGKLAQTHTGWAGNREWVINSDLEIKFLDSAARYENGGLNFIAIKGLAESIKTYLALGKKDVEAQILFLTQYLIDKVGQLQGYTLLRKFNSENRSGITVIELPEGMELTNEELANAGVRARLIKSNLLRISCHFYNHTQDIDQMFEILGKLVKR
ncbi:MAG: aminotransferase class V-fold PLP-dependent enzyme [Anaerolineaceae bacterium]|nr:aminotransferase class V-fold PLP-dependent enzyme [Anaerolineaceae bacterium]